MFDLYFLWQHDLQVRMQPKGCVRKGTIRISPAGKCSFFKSQLVASSLIYWYCVFIFFSPFCFDLTHIHSTNERSIENRFHSENKKGIFEIHRRNYRVREKERERAGEIRNIGKWWHVGTREMLMLPRHPLWVSTSFREVFFFFFSLFSTLFLRFFHFFFLVKERKPWDLEYLTIIAVTTNTEQIKTERKKKLLRFQSEISQKRYRSTSIIN